jgi:hypothetical protein
MVTNCFNRDGLGFNTFNEREGGPLAGAPADDLIPATASTATSLANIAGYTYPNAQNATRDAPSTWRGEEGHTRAVQCHNNLANGADENTIWQAVE